MARIRTIKPSFWAEDHHADLSLEARLVLIGLISFADDEGRFLASPSAVSGYVFPHDEIPPAKMRRWLAEIAALPNVQLYTVGKREYGVFLKYKDHQRISHPQPSSLPGPPINGVEQERFHT